MEIDLSKKRKTDDYGGQFTDFAGASYDAFPQPPSLAALGLTQEDARKVLEPLTKDQLLDILQSIVVRDTAALEFVRAIADSDPTLRKLFIRSLGWETTSDKLQSVFSDFGELEEAVVITDKVSGKSKGYGFVIYKHIDGAVLALKEPNKKIDGRITVAQLAAARESSSSDVLTRKIYVGNVPYEIPPERLLSHFSLYGEVEEGPLGFEKFSDKQKGFAFFIYKTEEGARNALVDPMKSIDEHQVVCKYASDGRRGKAGGPQGQTGMTGDAAPLPGPVAEPLNTGYGMPGGQTQFSGFPGGPPVATYQNPGGQGFGNQGPPAFGSGYAGVGYGSGPHYSGGAGSGEYPGFNNYGPSMNMLPPDVGNYGLPSAYYSQQQRPPAGPRGPLGGMYQGRPPYY